MSSIFQAAELLRAGGVVAFPTETVYGLGADATNAEAVQRIFDAKGRPGTNPLIVHVADVATARRFAAAWPEAADRLAEVFWPGPLTIVLSKTEAIADAVTAGRRTVGLRVPDHPVALELLRTFAGPIAAPSANRSNRVSPTKAEHVRDELGDAVDLVLDGGACRVGIESTVIDLSTDRPVILRPGGITREQIEAVIGPVEVFQGFVAADVSASSPGQHPTHYAPRTPAYRVEPGQRAPENLDGKPCGYLPLSADPGQYTRDLYAQLRKLDAGGFAAIFIESPPDVSAWRGVRDRVYRATKPFG